jgi:hypothetical protein
MAGRFFAHRAQLSESEALSAESICADKLEETSPILRRTNWVSTVARFSHS